MLARKRRSEKQIEELENSNSLFKECKKDNNEKTSLISRLKKSNECYTKCFISILKTLSNFSKSLSIFEQEDENQHFSGIETFLDVSKESNKGFQLLQKILQGLDNLEEQEFLNSDLILNLESIENKLTKLITNLINIKTSKNINQITKLIDEGISDEMVEFFNKEIIEENKILRKELAKIKEILEESINKYNMNETENLKIHLGTKTKEIIELNKKMEEIKNLNRQTRQKLNSSPYLPYIILEGMNSLSIKNHNCLCYYCGFDINYKECDSINETPNNNFCLMKNVGNDLNLNEEKSKTLCGVEYKQDIIMLDNSNNNSNKISDDKMKQYENEDSNKIDFPSLNKTNETVNLNQIIDINNENSYKSQPNLINEVNQSQINVCANLNSPHLSSDYENEILDKYNLNVLYKRLYEAYINLKCEKVYSYQTILKSKPFQILLAQNENLVNLIENQKIEILNSKKQLNEIYNDLKSQEKLLKLDKIKDISTFELKIEDLEKDLNNAEIEKGKLQAEITKNEEIIKTLKIFDYSQLNSIEEYYANKNTSLLEVLKSQAKTYSDKFQAEFEKAESLEKQNIKLTIELDRFKTALSKYESVEGVENLQFEKFDMREREEMKRQIKSYKDKYTNCEKSYRIIKSDLKMEKENSDKLFMEIVLNEKGIEQMNKTIKELTQSINENNEKIGFLLNEKLKNTEIIRNLNDYIKKLESEYKDISDFQKEIHIIDENYLKEIKLKQDIIKKLEQLIKFKNSSIDILYYRINQLTRENVSLNNSNIELVKTIDSLKTKTSKKITELQLKLEKSAPIQKREYSNKNLVFSDKKSEDEFELLRLENDTYKKKLQCKICSIRDIDVIINKCNHTFCRDCITNLINSRQRICPKCRCKISMNDVTDIWLD